MDITLSNVIVKIGKEKNKEQRILFSIPQLSIKQNEKILIKGSSGKGKTTFLHLLAGLFSPSAGTITVGAADFTKMTEDARSVFRRKNIGIVFQKLNLIEHLSLLENIQLSLANPKDLSKAMSALTSVGLSGRENDRVSVLSLGEQQRVAVARVLASESKIVFADEPTSSLDEKNAFEVTELLLQACRDKTLIVVSHDERINKYFPVIKNFEELIS